MKTRVLGKTGISISEIGFGCASVFGKSFFSNADAERVFRTAFDNCITFFDTGYSYGNAEEKLGKCIRNLTGNERTKLVISTKFGTRVDKSGKYIHDWDPSWLEESLNTSFYRLGVDRVDLIQLHGPSIKDITDEILTYLDKLKSSGKVAAIGVNTFDTDVLEYINQSRNFDFVMMDYNLMRQDREPLIQQMNNNGIGIIAGAALAESLFSNRIFKVHNKKDFWYLARALKNFRGQLFEGLSYRFIDSVPGLTGQQIALRYVLNNDNVASAVFGSANSDHIIQNIKASDIEMPPEVTVKITNNRSKNSRHLDRV